MIIPDLCTNQPVQTPERKVAWRKPPASDTDRPCPTVTTPWKRPFQTSPHREPARSALTYLPRETKNARRLHTSCTAVQPRSLREDLSAAWPPSALALALVVAPNWEAAHATEAEQARPGSREPRARLQSPPASRAAETRDAGRRHDGRPGPAPTGEPVRRYRVPGPPRGATGEPGESPVPKITAVSRVARQRENLKRGGDSR